MTFTQIHETINLLAKEVLGEEAINVVDTSTFVAVGSKILSSDTNKEQFYKALADRIGKVIVSVRSYGRHNVNGVSKNEMEFGCILQKIHYTMPESNSNPAWIFDTQANPYDTTNTISVKAKLLVAGGTYSFETKIPDYQLKTAFINEVNMSAFISGLYTTISNAMDLAIENNNNMAVATGIAVALNSNKATVKRNLLKEYNTLYVKTLTQANCLSDKDFLLFAVNEMIIVKNSITRFSTLFNADGEEKFTPIANLNVEMLSDFDIAIKSRLLASTYNKDLIELPKYSPVPYWQGTGTGNTFADKSKINVTIEGKSEAIVQNGIICYMHDDMAVSSTIMNERIASVFNPFADVTNYQHKAYLSYAVDGAENGVVFYVADEV